MASAPDAFSELTLATTPPPEGERVRVFHEDGTYGAGSATGVYRDGKWACSEVFICPHTMRMFMNPTHWAPLAEQHK